MILPSPARPEARLPALSLFVIRTITTKKGDLFRFGGQAPSEGKFEVIGQSPTLYRQVLQFLDVMVSAAFSLFFYERFVVSVLFFFGKSHFTVH